MPVAKHNYFHFAQKRMVQNLQILRNVIVLKLLGETADNKPVLESVSVKHKPRCVTCGQQNRAHANFCAKCGTALEIYA